VEQENVAADVMNDQDGNTVVEAIDQPATEAKSDSYIYEAPDKRTIALVMVLSFVIPVIIMALAFLKVRISPNGRFTVLIYDMQAQYMPVYASLRYLGKTDHSFFYSFFGALGNNTLLVYKSYFANPLLWLTVLFPLEQLPNVLYFITLFFVGLCGLSFSTFLFFGRKKDRDSKYPLFVLVLSCCYALTSFNVAYSMCINWLLEVSLLPIILLGIERMIEGKKGAIYVLALTYALYNSDQLPYISGIFATLYLFFRLSDAKERKIRVLIRFGVCSLLSLGLACPVFVPMIVNIMAGRMKTYDTMEGKFFYFPIWESFKQLLSCHYDTIKEAGLPNIFCGSFVPILAIIGLVKGKKTNRERIVAICILCFFFLSFCIVPLNQFWHGFTEPNAFPVRYAYTFCAFLLILAYDSAAFLYRKVSAPGKIGICVPVIVLTVTFAELYLNSGFMLTSNNLFLGYKTNMEYQLYLREVSDAMGHIDDDDFYRIGRDITYTSNDGMLWGYNGIEYFSSMFERNTMDLLGMLGYSQNEHMLRDYGGTPLVESLLGVKYKIMNEPENFWSYDSIYKNNSFDLQLNQDALSLGFLGNQNGIPADEVSKLQEGINDHNSFALQEYIISDLTGSRANIYNSIDYDIEDFVSDEYSRKIRITFKADEKKPVWLYCKDTDGVRIFTSEKTEETVDHVELLINGNQKYAFMDPLSTMCTYIGEFEAGEEVVIEAASTIWFDDPWLVYYDPAACRKALDTLKENELTVTEHHSGHISGTINVPEENRALILTIPYMAGYTIKIDDVITDYGAYGDSLVAIPLSVGEHTVEISFFPPGLKAGLITGAVSLVLSALILLIPTRKKEDETVDMQQS